MKIIILGAGQVGGSLAERLTDENNDITVVDKDADVLRNLQDHLDINTVAGDSAHPETLRQAGADEADMLIAVTNSDEINMMACQVAHSLFNTPTKISRIRSQNYLSHKADLFLDDHIPVDVIIGPEELITRNIGQLIAHPGSLQALDFANQRAQLVAVRVQPGAPIVGQALKEIRAHMPKVDARVAAIYRQDTPIIPVGTTIIEEGDEVFFIAATADIQAVVAELTAVHDRYNRILIAGGGNIGSTLAESLEEQYNVKIIEKSHSRCKLLSERLRETIVLEGSASDPQLLTEEGIESIDVFCALTDNDESNIMMSMLAKRLGARKVITLISNSTYADLIGDEIDIPISPQQITIGSLLAHIRRGDVSVVHSLRRGVAEAMELIAHGDKKSSRVVGRRLDEIGLPHGVTIGAVVRGKEVFIAHDHIIIEPDDHVILFVTDKTHIPKVEKLFAVEFGFFS